MLFILTARVPLGPLAGADGKPEKIHISNEDDWMWGVRRTKAATWSLKPTTAPGRETPRFVTFYFDAK